LATTSPVRPASSSFPATMAAPPDDALDGATNAELIARVLAAPDADEDAWWPSLEELRARPTRETFDGAVALLASDAMAERELAVDILGALGGSGSDPQRPFREETVVLLLDLLRRERESRVLESLGYAFGHLDEPRGVAPLSALAGHPEVRVREGVIGGLLRHEDERAVAALIQLSADEADEIRDWATFGLGTQIPLDTPAIRAALAARLDDPHEDTREEAMYGLAMRLDARAIPVLLAFLEDGEGPMLDSALLVLGDHLEDPRLPAAVARRWPDGVPTQARDQADADYELACFAPQDGR
jgi:HEAT repeat protein